MTQKIEPIAHNVERVDTVSSDTIVSGTVVSNKVMSNRMINNKKRKTLAVLFAGGGLLAVLPSQWKKPLINSVLVPAHAQTSPEPEPETCSGGFVTEPVNSPLQLVITADEILGPIVVTRDGSASFSGFSNSVVDQCLGNRELSEEVTFTGTIDSATNQVTGDLTIIQLCGTQLVCEQLTSFTVTQDPVVAGDDLGTYSGTLTGTLRCCVDFL